MPGCSEKELYQMFCEKRFDKIDDQQQKMLEILRGRNGDPGLIDDVRQLKGRWALIFGAFVVVFTALGTELIQWLFKVL